MDFRLVHPWPILLGLGVILLIAILALTLHTRKRQNVFRQEAEADRIRLARLSRVLTVEPAGDVISEWEESQLARYAQGEIPTEPTCLVRPRKAS